MITAERRGFQVGSEQARVCTQRPDVSTEWLEGKARKVWREMKAQWYAHIDPQEEFIRGFVPGFEQFFLLQGVNNVHHVEQP